MANVCLFCRSGCCRWVSAFFASSASSEQMRNMCGWAVPLGLDGARVGFVPCPCFFRIIKMAQKADMDPWQARCAICFRVYAFLFLQLLDQKMHDFTNLRTKMFSQHQALQTHGTHEYESRVQAKTYQRGPSCNQANGNTILRLAR